MQVSFETHLTHTFDTFQFDSFPANSISLYSRYSIVGGWPGFIIQSSFGGFLAIVNIAARNRVVSVSEVG